MDSDKDGVAAVAAIADSAKQQHHEQQFRKRATDSNQCHIAPAAAKLPAASAASEPGNCHVRLHNSSYLR
jgi:hypothetical protein